MRLHECNRSIRILPVLTRATTKKWSLQRTRQLATAPSLQVERYDITCGISGGITVEVHNPILLRNSPTTPLVIYLPPYPSSPLPPLHPPSWLLNSYPVFNIPYRWSHNPSISFRNQKSHPFPIPLHDTLQAYSWLLNRYLPYLLLGGRSLDTTSLINHPQPIQRPLLIYGSYLGGTLATSLALTESYNSPLLPTNIQSLIVHNGIFDWTPISTTPDPSIFPSESSNSSSPKPSYNDLSTLELYTHSPWTSRTLHALKTRLFPSPSQTFDPFASPLLFFRNPGIQVPQRWPIPPPLSSSSSPSRRPPSSSPTNKQTSPKPAINSTESDNFPPYTNPSSPPQNPRNKTSTLSSTSDEEYPHEPLLESRKANLYFPHPNSSLQTPRSLFTYSSSTAQNSTTQTHMKEKEEDQNIFKQQAQELSKLMRRSIRESEFKKGVKEVEIEEEGWDGERERERLVREWIEEGGF
ncbi:hypothetical protein EAF04_007726 [Stromatinia cepivora]|nr:hypothetical protein EAF04_007726 [Stromatinia cepivora]